MNQLTMDFGNVIQKPQLLQRDNQLDLGFDYPSLKYQPNLDPNTMYTRFWSDDLQPGRVGVTKPSIRNKKDFIVVFPERRVSYLTDDFSSYVGESLSEAIAQFLPRNSESEAGTAGSPHRKPPRMRAVEGEKPRDALGRFIKRSEFSYNRIYSPYESFIVGNLSKLTLVCAMYQTTCKRRNGNIEGRYCIGLKFTDEDSFLDRSARFWLEFKVKYDKLGNFWGLVPQESFVEAIFSNINRLDLCIKFKVPQSESLSKNLETVAHNGNLKLRTLLLELLFLVPIASRYTNIPSINFNRGIEQASEFPLWSERFVNFIDPAVRKDVDKASHINEFLTIQTGYPLGLYDELKSKLDGQEINVLNGRLGRKFFFGYLFNPQRMSTQIDVNQAFKILKTINTIVNLYGDVSYLNHIYEILENSNISEILMFNNPPNMESNLKALLNLKVVKAFPRPKQWRIIDDAIGLFPVKSHPEWIRLSANAEQYGVKDTLVYVRNRIEEDAHDSINMEQQILGYKVDATEHIRGKDVKNLKDLHDQMVKLHVTLKDKPKPTPDALYDWLRENLELSPTLRIVIPKDDNTIKMWGQAQRHCLASYASGVIAGNTIVIGIEKVDPDTGKGTYPNDWLGHVQFSAYEISDHPGANRYATTSSTVPIHINQFYGQSNSQIDQKYHSLLKLHLTETYKEYQAKLQEWAKALKEEERKKKVEAAKAKKKAKQEIELDSSDSIKELLI